MSEYWQSIPKIYCKFCNVWYQDNRSSRDFHERSFKHKNNISRHIVDVQKKSREKEKEDAEFKKEMQRIERAAMVAYEKDLVNRPIASTSSLNQEKDELKIKLEKLQQQETSEQFRQEALDIVSTKLKKKHEWFESKTIEGKVYYYNRTTMETKWIEPKSGYVSIEEQKEMNITDVPGDQSKASREGKRFKHEQFASGWQEVSSGVNVDLQLPKCKVKQKLESNIDIKKQEKLKFEDKKLDSESVFKSKKKETNFGFKKRKWNNSESRRVKNDE